MTGAAFRGQPLLLFAVLLIAWFGLRAALWQPPFRIPVPPSASRAASFPPDKAAGIPRPGTPFGAPVPPRIHAARLLSLSASQGPVLLPYAASAVSAAAPAVSTVALAPQERQAPPGIPAAGPLLVTALQEPAATGDQAGSRWSGDAWLLLRPEATTPLAPGTPSYGRSQAGAVLRYALAPGRASRPQAYVRASAAVTGPRERQLAAGVSVRPLARIPIRVAVEAQGTDTAGGTGLRPAAYAVTELPSARLPLDLRGEAYLQGGYVGGRLATAFIDGQARIERPLARIGTAQVSAGLGAWGGAQKGAARLDAGPALAATFALGRARGRLAADYRFRVAGDAAPESGPAVTLSAGF